MVIYLIVIITIFKLLKDCGKYTQHQQWKNFVHAKGKLNEKYNGFSGNNVFPGDPRYPEYQKEINDLKKRYS